MRPLPFCFCFASGSVLPEVQQCVMNPPDAVGVAWGPHHCADEADAARYGG